MWPYWLMFMLPASAALIEQREASRHSRRVSSWNTGALVAAFLLTLAVGYRHEVGGDWGAYLRQFDDIQGMSLEEVLTLSDPGYALLNWLSGQMDGGIYGVNLVCGAIFATALIHFCLSLPRPWLAMTVAVPYLVIVVAMGYSRQGVALAFAMLGLTALKRRSVFWFVVWGLLGATFHKTAILLLPIAALASSRNRWWSIGLAAVTTYVGYLVLLQDSFETMYTNYVEAEMQSEGALVRLLMNAVPAAILLVWGKRFNFSEAERSLWRWFAFISLALLLALFAGGSASTAVDRMALYMLPLQLVVFSHLPGVLFSRGRSNASMVSIGVVGYYATVQYVWLNFATYSVYWQPYRFYLLDF